MPIHTHMGFKWILWWILCVICCFSFSLFFFGFIFETSSEAHSVMCIAGSVGIRFSFLESKNHHVDDSPHFKGKRYCIFSCVNFIVDLSLQ